jgi:hypothetical protein
MLSRGDLIITRQSARVDWARNVGMGVAVRLGRKVLKGCGGGWGNGDVSLDDGRRPSPAPPFRILRLLKQPLRRRLQRPFCRACITRTCLLPCACRKTHLLEHR